MECVWHRAAGTTMSEYGAKIIMEYRKKQGKDFHLKIHGKTLIFYFLWNFEMRDSYVHQI